MPKRPPEERRQSGRKALPPLDVAGMERMALRYVERFATTRGKLIQYLNRKIRERGWDGAVGDPAALADRMVELGYIDDRAFGEARAAAMARRGLGMRRVVGEFRHAGIGEEDAAALAPAIADRARDAALTFAKRKRIGPFAPEPVERALREKHIAAMIRAGHDFALARRIAMLGPGDPVDDIVSG